MKRGLNIQINFTNRVIYTFVAFILLLIIGVTVFALTPGVAPNPGHLIDNVAPPSLCSAGQVLQWGGVDWICTGGLSPWTISGSNIFFEGAISAGSTSSPAYNNFGAGQTPDSGDITTDDDVFIHQDLEVEGRIYLTGGYTGIFNADIAEVLLTEKGREHVLCEGDPNCTVSEEYVQDELESGDLVCLNLRVGQTIERCTEANSRLAIGFVSNTSVLKMGNSVQIGYPIAVAGVVYAKVTNSNGNINPGDLLVSADRDGYAMKNNNPRERAVVAKSFDFCYEEECKILIFVALS